ncbi:SGNH/GDSL hydrolase family protein [Prosthecodimorpha hirschii]|uniref:SGNH/GDSL hydrolase family protein n=1 Tax=Prosthecodimorpha hirschii TaxID=665126 RepID=UPI001FEEEA7C|nr:DUF459 domain-containing protein [Prosthecomicrobium hirschii]
MPILPETMPAAPVTAAPRLRVAGRAGDRPGRLAGLVRFAAVLLLAVVSVLAAAPPAAAQNDGGGFFRFLFGGGRQQAPTPPGGIGNRPPAGQYPAPPGGFGYPGQPETAAPPPRPRVSNPEPRIIEQPKDADAQVVLVLGDSQAAGLALGLQVAFADTPSVKVVSKARPSLSLVRDDEYDFLAQLPAMLQEGRFDFLVVMSGINDRQSFYDRKTGQKTDDLKTDKWEVAYRARIGAVLKALRETGKPIYWVGQPPVERPTLSAFLSVTNGIVKQLVEANGATFIDIWPGFTDDEGNFTYSGPDVDGKEKKLRAGDGTHFNRAGQRKLAFFVEQSIRDQLKGVAPAPEPALPEAPAAPVLPQEVILAAPPPLPPAPWKKIGPVVSLSGQVAPDAETELAGGPAPAAPGAPAARTSGSIVTVAPAPTPVLVKPSDAMPGGFPITETPLYRRFVRGESIEAPTGRIDDFRWRRPR